MDPNTQPSAPQQSNNSMMLIIGIVVLLIIGAGAWFLMSQSNQNQQPAAETATEQSPAAGTSEESQLPEGESTAEASPAADAKEEEGSVKEFTVTGRNFSFSPTQMRVKAGDTVRITFENTGGFHDFVIDEFDVRTPQIQDGQSETIEFVADKAGTYEYYCSIGRHREMGMKGTLIVE